jgi:acetyl-CoA acyltransferase 1
MATKSLTTLLHKLPTDILLLSPVRTAITRSYKGSLKDTHPEHLLATILSSLLKRTPALSRNAVEDVGVGVVLSELGGSKAARMAMNHVGYPSSTSLWTCNRACASSLQAIAMMALEVRNGEMVGEKKVGIAAGMESMTRNYGSRAIPVDLWPALRESEVEDARDCIMPMGITSEIVASKYNVSREDQDAFAVESHLRASRAQKEGSFDKEIAAVETTFQEVDKEGKNVGEPKGVTVTKDDGIRHDISLEKMKKLKPAFKPDGASTAGNSSQISDGAAGVIIATRRTVEALGLGEYVAGRFVSAVTAGVKPNEMGIGPAVAIPKLLARHGLEVSDVGRWEINEAFASQSLYCLRELDLLEAWKDGKVNPDGGAIALGHPLGATGARMVSTLLHGMGRDGSEVGVVSMCVGTGMGMAGLFVKE